MFSFLRLSLLFLALVYASFSHATISMADTEFQLKLSDGTAIWVNSAGYADSQWLEMASGQVIVKRDGYWYKGVVHDDVEGVRQQALSTGAPLAGGPSLPPEIASIFRADTTTPNKGLMLTSTSKSNTQSSIAASDNADILSAQSFALSPSEEPYFQPILLLRVSFNDQSFQYPLSNFQQLMFSESGSVAQYYRENSYQKFRLEPADESFGDSSDGIIDISLPYSHPNFGASYGQASRNLARDAVKSASAHIDFKRYDKNDDGQLSPRELGIVLMIAGYENAYGGAGASEPNIWAHKTEFSGVAVDGVSLSSYAMFGERHQGHLATIGIISHEMGHLLFSLPDLYDRQGDSNGVGRWGLMGLGSWNSTTGHSGSSPAHMLAWSKVKAGFLKPQDIEGSQADFSLSPTTMGEEAMRIWLDPFKHGEHFLLEYRTQAGFDQGLPGEGLLISHVDDWVGYGVVGAQNDVAEHKLVDIEEADGRSDLDMMENRGDRLDVFNDAYGQSHFGSYSSPASLNYQGDTSGVEVSKIRVSDIAQGEIALPYARLGNNLGYDDGGIGISWGGADSSSLIEYLIPSDMTFIHGLDVFSHVDSTVVATIYSSLQQGVVSNEIFISHSQVLTPGWNRVVFDQVVDVGQFEKIYLQLVVNEGSSRGFTIDTAGDVSHRSYVKSNGKYQKASFDFNQRLLIAGQEEKFSYQVPDKLPLHIETSKKASAGYLAGAFIVLLMIMSFIGRSDWGYRKTAL